MMHPDILRQDKPNDSHPAKQRPECSRDSECKADCHSLILQRVNRYHYHLQPDTRISIPFHHQNQVIQNSVYRYFEVALEPAVHFDVQAE